jgi:hypothetical protein
MAKKKPHPASGSLEAQIRAAAEECGLTHAEAVEAAQAHLAGARQTGAAAAVGAPGDRLAKWLAFLEKLLPIILPLLNEQK